jgi:hypothetical protein
MANSKFVNLLNQSFIKAKFKKLKADFSNIDEVFTNNINIWYYFNSDSVTKKDGIKKISSGTDTINNLFLLNPDNFIFSKTKQGFNLTENDFISLELKELNKIENLSFIEQKQFDFYKYYLLKKLDQPQQLETIEPDEVKKELHNHIFKNNAFEVWQSMFDEFEINEKSRTNVKFMFEEMKKEELIHNTVNQTTFLEWITSTYNGLIVIKTSNHSRSITRLQAYSRAIQLYKK